MDTKSIRLKADGNFSVEGSDLTPNASLKMNDQTFMSRHVTHQEIYNASYEVLLALKKTIWTTQLLSSV